MFVCVGEGGGGSLEMIMKVTESEISVVGVTSNVTGGTYREPFREASVSLNR